MTTKSGAGGISTALDHVAAKLKAWREQRAQMAAEIDQIIDRATTMRTELGNVDAPSPSRVRRGGRPAGYRISSVTRAKLKAAWARRKAANGTKATASKPVRKKSTMSPEAKARIVAAQKKRWAAWRKSHGK